MGHNAPGLRALYKGPCIFSTKVLVVPHNKSLCTLPDVKMSYAQRLNKALDLRGMSQSELARRVGIKAQAVQYLAEEKNNATGSKHTEAFAREMQINAAWLAREEGEMELPEGTSHRTIFTEAELNSAWRGYSHELKTRIVELIRLTAATAQDETTSPTPPAPDAPSSAEVEGAKLRQQRRLERGKKRRSRGDG